MPSSLNLRDTLLNSWKTNNRVNVFLVEHLPAELWDAKLPGEPRRTIRMVAVHIHNARCRWIKTLGKPHGIAVPRMADRYKAKSKDLVPALESSSEGILSLLILGCDQGGSIPPTKAYVWRNLPLDVGHVLSYFVAHEGHHRGQLVMLARQLGHRLPMEVVGGIWQWNRLSKET